MKNIHVLSTDKPSRLYLTTHEYIFEKGYSLSTDECENKHIYITSSDEKIKKGDWCLLNSRLVVRYFEPSVKSKSFKKIILTTDQDLIKDGVQAIDNEFLEWFVKNPSCEFVDFEYGDDGNGYQIIIPKEESTIFKIAAKQFQKEFNKEVGNVLTKELNKQETLEEVSERFSKQFLNNGIIQNLKLKQHY